MPPLDKSPSLNLKVFLYTRRFQALLYIYQPLQSLTLSSKHPRGKGFAPHPGLNRAHPHCTGV